MSFGHWLTFNLCPLLLRLGLALVFLWAGWAKLAYNDPVSGQQAATMANLGIIEPATPFIPATPSTPVVPTDETDAEPVSEPITDPVPDPQTDPVSDPPTDPTRDDNKQPPTESLGSRGVGSSFLMLASAPTVPVVVPPAAPAASAPTLAPRYTAEDFPDTIMVRRLYKVGLMLDAAARPADPAKQLWPTPLATPEAIRALCWAAALTEFIGGAFMLFGFLTRLAAVGLMGTMFTAMLLTTIGPAALSGSGFLGFLPDPKMNDPAAWVAAWQTFLFQVVLLLMALSVFFSGAGAFSLDRVFFGRARAKRTYSAAKID